VNVRRGIKRGIKRLFAVAGYQVSKIQPVAPVAAPPPPGVDRSTMRGAVISLGRRLPNVATIIDVGASNGMWSLLAMESYPHSRYWLIEAQAVHEPALQQFCREHANAGYILAAAGATVGQIYFDTTSPWGGAAGYQPFKENNRVVPVTTIDQQVQAQGLTGPFLLKLDTHGFEVPIFQGASQTLADTAAIVVECYNFKISSESLEFSEMSAWLKERGFHCMDIVDLMRRPGDDAFWQMDMVFLRADRPEFARLGYD